MRWPRHPILPTEEVIRGNRRLRLVWLDAGAGVRRGGPERRSESRDYDPESALPRVSRALGGAYSFMEVFMR